MTSDAAPAQEGSSQGVSSQGSSRSVVAALGLMTLALLVVLPAFLWFGYQRYEYPGVLAAGVAVGVCWVGSAGALLVAGLLRRSDNTPVALLAGMVLRMGLPLGTVAFLITQQHALVGAGVVGMTLVCYLIALVVETVLSLRLVGNPGRVSKAS